MACSSLHHVCTLYPSSLSLLLQQHPGAPPQHHILPAFIRQLSEPRYQGPDDGKQGTKGDEKDNADDKKYIPGSDQHLQRVVMDAGSPGCFAVIGDTLYYNKCLTCMTVFMWTFGIAAAVCGVKGYGSFKGLFITALVFYGIYFISFICLAGVICYCQCCMGGPAVGDYVCIISLLLMMYRGGYLHTTPLLCRSYRHSLYLSRLPPVLFWHSHRAYSLIALPSYSFPLLSSPSNL